MVLLDADSGTRCRRFDEARRDQLAWVRNACMKRNVPLHSDDNNKKRQIDSYLIQQVSSGSSFPFIIASSLPPAFGGC